MEDPFRYPPSRAGEPIQGLEEPAPPSETPNHIPEGERYWNGFLSFLLLAYGTYGAIVEHIYLPGRHGGIHFYGRAAWFAYGAMLFAAANMISVIVDHYDKRNNETNYRLFSRVTQVIALVLFSVACLVQCSSKWSSRQAVRPNPSLKLTRYGRLCKPGPWHMVHHHRPGLHSLPPRAA
jgi:hypothetical protein